MSQALTLARPYARAAFALARDGGRYAEWSNALGIGAQFLEQAGDFRQQREAAVVGQQAEDAGERLVAAIHREQTNGVGRAQQRMAEQRLRLRFGGNARGEGERLRPCSGATAVSRQGEGGAGVRTGEGQCLGHR